MANKRNDRRNQRREEAEARKLNPSSETVQERVDRFNVRARENRYVATNDYYAMARVNHRFENLVRYLKEDPWILKAEEDSKFI